MTVKDIIYYSCLMCGKEELAEKIADGAVPDLNPEIVRFLNCYNLTVMELSEDVEPLVFKESMYSADGNYAYENFTKPPKEIISVTSDGKNVAFNVLPDKIETDVTHCEITYDYRAHRATGLNETCEYDENVFSSRVLAMGVASEYLLISGLYEEAMTWRERYEKAIETFVIGKKRRIRSRVWA
ncbi:MAG: hypothetical protein J5762_03960 [Clostridia bacterium]|nr:hypothetical protein [Clostridia bacterium]